jgi:selenocysteine lyase/cysteine desulfurase
VSALDVARLQKDFPILDRTVHDHRLVYLDSAATSQKPRAVIDAMSRFYETSNANIHRGTYQMAVEATEAYEAARAAVARFIGAPSPTGLVFTKNVTEAINLVAASWGGANLREGDAVVLTEVEHHANLVPWLMLKDRLGIELRFVPMAEDYTLDLTDLDRLLDGFTTAEVPTKFEAGTMPFAEAVGLHAAVEYLSSVGMEAVREHEVSLTAYALRALRERHGDDVTVYGPSEPAMRGGALSFSYKDIHPHDVSQVLDQKAICVRAGHHCAKPLMRLLGVGATTRASLYLYNDEADVDALVDGLSDADDLFSL